MSDNTYENKNVQLVSSLVDEIIEDMNNLEVSTSYVRGGFGTALNDKMMSYKDVAADLSTYTTDSFIPASETIKVYRENIVKEQALERNINEQAESIKKNVYNSVKEQTNSDSSAMQAAEQAERQFRAQRQKEIDQIKSENDTLRSKVEQLSEQSLLEGPGVVPYRYGNIDDGEQDVPPPGVELGPEPNPVTLTPITAEPGVQTKYGAPPAPPSTTTEVITITIPTHPGQDHETTQHITITHPVQTKYGVPNPAPPSPDVQTKYGVVCATPTPTVQTKYGVVPPPQTTQINVMVTDPTGGVHVINPTIQIGNVQTKYGVVGGCLPWEVQTRYGIKGCN